MESRATLLADQLPRSIRPGWSGLRARMTISYMLVTLGSLFTFLILAVLLTNTLAAFFSDPLGDRSFLTAVQQQAQAYALAAAVQARGVALDPRTNFIPGQAATLVSQNQTNQFYDVSAPYIAQGSPDPATRALVLLIGPAGRLVASSYPSRYAVGMPLSVLTLVQRAAIAQALKGQATVGTARGSARGGVAYDAEPVWSKEHHPIGAIFLQAPPPLRNIVVSLQESISLNNILVLLLLPPVGVFFGWIATRGLVSRLQRLVVVSARFAAGDYTQRVPLSQRDEIGQLEEQFNVMAGRLVEQIAQRQRLAEQNARLAERERISRHLHDAISQDLFSVSMLAAGLQKALPDDSPFQHQVETLELTTNTMIREMRALLLELRPMALEHLSLDKALLELVDAYRTRLGITIRVDLSSQKLATEIEQALMRIAQEALSNAARHAHASEIILALTISDKEVALRVRDNGRGFAGEDASLRHGLGLRLLRERVAELHGVVQVESRLGAGTTLTVRLPLEEQL